MMLTFFLCLFLFMGVCSFLHGIYSRKKPYTLIQQDYELSKMCLSPESVDLYANKISNGLRLFGVFYFIFAFVQYWVGNPELSLVGIFLPPAVFVIYMFYCRKILLGKISILAIGLIILVVISPLAFIVPSYIESSLIVDDEKVRITGIYGEEIPLDRLKGVSLADTLPNIGIRTNGISTGTVNRGYFYSKSLQKNVKLLIRSGSKPYLYIIYGDNKYVILNFKNREKTIEVYGQLKGIVGGE